MYDESAGDRPLTQEEDLAKLNEVYEDFAKFFEKQYLNEMETDGKVSTLEVIDRTSILNLISSISVW